MIARFLVLAAAVRLAFAFSDTAPVVAWSSRSSPSLDTASFAGFQDLASVFNHLTADDTICSHEAVILVDRPGLHVSDLRTIPASSSLTRYIESAKSSLQLSYAKRSNGLGAGDVAEAIATRCGSRVTQYTPGPAEQLNLAANDKQVVSMSLPHSGASNAGMSDFASVISSELEALVSSFPNYLVVVSGFSSGPSHSKRDMPNSNVLADAFEMRVTTAPASNSTLPEGGLLKRYQLLTPGLIISLALVFFVLVPAGMAGFNALSSIQAPATMVAPKGFSADSKKNQ